MAVIVWWQFLPWDPHRAELSASAGSDYKVCTLGIAHNLQVFLLIMAPLSIEFLVGGPYAMGTLQTGSERPRNAA